MNYTEALEIIQTKTKSRQTIKKIDKLLYDKRTTTFEKNGLRKMKDKAKDQFMLAHSKFELAGQIINEYDAYNSRKLPGIK